MEALDGRVAAHVTNPHTTVSANATADQRRSDAVLVDEHSRESVGDVEVGEEPARGHEQVGGSQCLAGPAAATRQRSGVVDAGRADLLVDPALVAVATLPIDHELAAAEPPGVVQRDRVGNAAGATRLDRSDADALNAVKVHHVGFHRVEHLVETRDGRRVVESVRTIVSPFGQSHAKHADAFKLVAVERVRRRDGRGHGGEDVHVDAVLVVHQSIHVLRHDRRPAERPRSVKDIHRQDPRRLVATAGDQRRDLAAGDAGRR